MESSSVVQIMSKNETTSLVWTEEKHMHFLNTMEASFVTKMLHRYRLDRHLPDTSDSTLDSKPSPPNNKKHAPSPTDSMVPRVRRTRRRSSQPHNYFSQEQVVPQLENETEADACVVVGDKDKEVRSTVMFIVLLPNMPAKKD